MESEKSPDQQLCVDVHRSGFCFRLVHTPNEPHQLRVPRASFKMVPGMHFCNHPEPTLDPRDQCSVCVLLSIEFVHSFT